MKIPVFEEININNFNEEELKSLLSDSRIGKVPCYINLLLQPKTELNAIVVALEIVINELKLHPRFPYPTYLICQYPLTTTFPTVTSTKELPDHFFKKVKRPNNKELQLLNKLSLKVEKIGNLHREEILNKFFDSSIPQKKLYEISKELYFLETINHHQHEKNNIKQNEKQKK